MKFFILVSIFIATTLAQQSTIDVVDGNGNELIKGGSAVEPYNAYPGGILDTSVTNIVHDVTNYDGNYIVGLTIDSPVTNGDLINELLTMFTLENAEVDRSGTSLEEITTTDIDINYDTAFEVVEKYSEDGTPSEDLKEILDECVLKLTYIFPTDLSDPSITDFDPVDIWLEIPLKPAIDLRLCLSSICPEANKSEEELRG